MIRISLLGLLILNTCLLVGQIEVRMVFSPGGAHDEMGGTHYSYTFGEPQIGTTVGGLSNLTMGFQQPEPNPVLAVNSLHLWGNWDAAFPTLTWQADQPDAVYQYQVERMSENGEYQRLILVASKAGTNHYFATDSSLFSDFDRALYRIRAWTANGAIILSNRLSLRRSPQQSGLTVFPDPADEYFTLEGQMLASSGIADITCFNASGQLVSKEQTSWQGHKLQHKLKTASWPSGWYLIQVVFAGRRARLPLLVTHP